MLFNGQRPTAALLRRDGARVRAGGRAARAAAAVLDWSMKCVHSWAVLLMPPRPMPSMPPASCHSGVRGAVGHATTPPHARRGGPAVAKCSLRSAYAWAMTASACLPPFITHTVPSLCPNPHTFLLPPDPIDAAVHERAQAPAQRAAQGQAAAGGGAHREVRRGWLRGWVSAMLVADLLVPLPWQATHMCRSAHGLCPGGPLVPHGQPAMPGASHGCSIPCHAPARRAAPRRLRLQDCANTTIGSSLARGISGGGEQAEGHCRTCIGAMQCCPVSHVHGSLRPCPSLTHAACRGQARLGWPDHDHVPRGAAVR